MSLGKRGSVKLPGFATSAAGRSLFWIIEGVGVFSTAATGPLDVSACCSFEPLAWDSGLT
jgi:hypothetical protein